MQSMKSTNRCTDGNVKKRRKSNVVRAKKVDGETGARERKEVIIIFKKKY